LPIKKEQLRHAMLTVTHVTDMKPRSASAAQQRPTTKVLYSLEATI
jgi:hypothetical protein